MATSGWVQEVSKDDRRVELNRSIVKPMEESDFQQMHDAVWAVRKTQTDLGLQIPSKQRLWEWASGVDALVSVMGERLQNEELTVLDVNPHGALLGPTLAYLYKMNVSEYEDSMPHRVARLAVNLKLGRAGKKTLRVEAGLPPVTNLYDAVLATDLHTCSADVWVSLARRVRYGGVLFVTIDLRNIGVEKLIDRMASCRLEGLVAMGKPQLHGNEMYKVGLIHIG